MKKKILSLFVLSVSVIFSTSAGAVIASGDDCGASGAECHWVIDDNGLLTVSGSGNMYSGDFPPWYSYRSSINNVVVEEGITSTGARAFEKSNAVSIVLPTTVQNRSIGNYFCYACTQLESITISDTTSYWGGRRFSSDHSLTIYCLGDPEKCRENIEETSGHNGGAYQHASYFQAAGYCYENSEGQTMCGDENGHPYVMLPTRPRRLIYTVPEAEAVSKKTGNKFRIRYK